MAKLKENWLTCEPNDFEYKTYLLLAYEQKLKEKFNNYELYPYMDDLLVNLTSTKDFLTSKKKLNSKKKSVKSVKKMTIEYESGIDHALIEHLQEVAQYAIKLFVDCYILGENKFEEMYKATKVFNISLYHSNPLEGVVIKDIQGIVKLYRFNVFKPLFKNADYEIEWEFIRQEKNTAQIVQDIVREYKYNVYIGKYALPYEKELHEESVTTVMKKMLLNRVVSNL